MQRALVLFAVGTLFALSLQGFRVWSVGGHLDVLVHIPDEEPMASYFREELGGFLARETKHDGVASYVIARSPLAVPEELLPVFPSWPYRYRRILYSLLGGGFGTFSPHAAILGLALLGAIGFGLTLAAFVELEREIFRDRTSPLWLLLVLGNPGFFYSLIFLTSDILAAGLSLSGYVLWRKKRQAVSILLFALSGLTKETALLLPAGLSLALLFKRKPVHAALLFSLPTLPLLLWGVWLAENLGSPFRLNERFELPLDWLSQLPVAVQSQSLFEASTLLLSLLFFILSTTAVFFTPFRQLIWLMAPWIALILFSSIELWTYGNSALRIFAFFFLLGGIAWQTIVEREKLRRSEAL